MRFYKHGTNRFLEHIIYSNFVVSISIGMLSYGICHQLKINNSEWYSLFIFSSTFLTYNVQRFLKAAKKKSHKTNLVKWLNHHRKQQYFLMGISFILLIISFLKVYTFGFLSLILLGASALVSLLYALPIKNKSLRDIPHLKIHLISLICLIAIGFFQLINENDFELKNWLFVGAHYFFILAVAIPFDIRDLQHDNPNQKTIPQVFGERTSKILSVFLLFLYTCLILLIKPVLSSNFAFLFIIIITSIVILNVHKDRSEFFFSGIIEGSIFALGIAFLLN